MDRETRSQAGRSSTLQGAYPRCVFSGQSKTFLSVVNLPVIIFNNNNYPNNITGDITQTNHGKHVIKIFFTNKTKEIRLGDKVRLLISGCTFLTSDIDSDRQSMRKFFIDE